MQGVNESFRTGIFLGGPSFFCQAIEVLEDS